MRTFQDLNKSIVPASFQFKELITVFYFHLVYDYGTKFPKILESIKVDDDLHVQLQCNGMPLPLPFFNFQACIRNTATGNYNEHLNECNKRTFYKRQGRPPNSASIILYALHLRYKSLQACRLLFEKSSNAIFVIAK